MSCPQGAEQVLMASVVAMPPCHSEDLDIDHPGVGGVYDERFDVGTSGMCATEMSRLDDGHVKSDVSSQMGRH